jgi:hypothetical protein
MPRKNILALLEGGDRRTIGLADDVAVLVSDHPELFPRAEPKDCEDYSREHDEASENLLDDPGVFHRSPKIKLALWGPRGNLQMCLSPDLAHQSEAEFCVRTQHHAFRRSVFGRGERGIDWIVVGLTTQTRDTPIMGREAGFMTALPAGPVQSKRLPH